MVKNQKITECPHCGSKDGFCIYTDYIGVPYMYGFNNEQKDNREMYDNTHRFHQHRYAYCIDCGEIIGTAKSC